MNHAVVADLAWGDSGKGSLTDYLCETRGYRTVIRFNGGVQAGHRVVREDGREHVFHQFGSGTFAGADTVLSRHMLVDPLAIAQEADELEARGIDHPLRRLYVDENALVTTPMHASANRLAETRRGLMNGRHGSCGAGIGATREYAINHPQDALRVGDLAWAGITENKLELLADRLGYPGRQNSMRELAAAYLRFTRSVEIIKSEQVGSVFLAQPCVFEGAQGVLLDEEWGFPPYYTWTDCTPQNAFMLMQDAGQTRDDATVFGLTRSYATRHGPGPFPTEDAQMTMALPDAANGFNAWQREWRCGPLDLVALRYAVEKACMGDVDELVVSCLDRIQYRRACHDYRTPTGEVTRDVPKSDTSFLESVRPLYPRGLRTVPDQIEDYLHLPVTVTSHGPTAVDKKER